MLQAILKFFGKNGTPKQSNNKSILVVDDGEIERRVMRKILEREGYRVFTANDGDSGVRAGLDEKPDLICLDIGLPDMLGTEACRRLKSHAETRHIPVLFMTGQDSPHYVIDSYDVGAEGYLTKPVDARTLVRQIEAILQDVGLSKSS